MNAMEQSAFATVSTRTPNIGDDIQVLAALQYLPSQAAIVDRDRVGRARLPPQTRMILNGWFMHSPSTWPPPPTVDPLVISFHAAPSKFRGSWRLDYLREQSRVRPIGARDLDTLALLREAGIEDAYWSGCLTLTLRQSEASARADHILAVDLPEQDLAVLRGLTTRAIVAESQLVGASHRSWHWRLFGRRKLDQTARLAQARRRLDEFASAAAVVTTRLHAALPSLALGTPVLFVTEKQMDPRLSSWLPHLRWCTSEDFRAGRFDFDFAEPPANPASWQPMAAALAETCSAFTGLRPRPYADVA